MNAPHDDHGIPPAAAPEAVLGLIAQFAEQLPAFRADKYNEQQLRIDFLNPVLQALGWDVANAAGQIEARRDVVYEDRVKVGGATKAPDYGLRLGGVRKFFVEAKKPSIDLRLDSRPAYQLRRYAWSAKLPLSILTDDEIATVEERG